MGQAHRWYKVYRDEVWSQYDETQINRAVIYCLPNGDKIY